MKRPSRLPDVLHQIYRYRSRIQFHMDELTELEQRIKHKIAQTKDKMHKIMESVVTDRLWPEIETLNWVLNEILLLRQRDEGFYSNI